MNYSEIIKLLDAGYSRDEILKMQEDPQQDPEPKQEEPQQDPEPQQDQTAAIMQEVKDMFAAMKKEFTAMNIMNSQQQSENVNTGDDAVAKIINPFKKEGK